GEVFLGKDYSTQQDYSDEVAAHIDEEVRGIIARGHGESREILTTHLDALHDLAEALLDRETLTAEEVAEILVGVPKWEHDPDGRTRIRIPRVAETATSAAMLNMGTEQ